MYNKVFISYAKEDISTAEKLYDYLIHSSFDPWLDKKKLLPGQNWDAEIRLALRKADFIIVLLSKTSVAKRGYVQREFKLALQYCEEKLEDDIYLIPCKIDDCEAPEKLNKYQWVELKNPDSFDLILSSLTIQRNKYLNYEEKRIAEKLSFEFDEVRVSKVVGDKPKNFIELVYPKFSDSTNETLGHLNTYIEGEIFESYYRFLDNFGPSHKEDNSSYKDNFIEDYNLPDNELNISYKIELLSKNIICYSLFYYSYTGGAHGNYGTIGNTYKLNPLIKLELEVLFDYQEEALGLIALLCKEKLLRKAKEEYEIGKEEEFFLGENPLKAEWETYNNFYLKKDSLVIVFRPYQLTAYSFGQHEIEIRYEELLNRIEGLRTLEIVSNQIKG